MVWLSAKFPLHQKYFQYVLYFMKKERINFTSA